MNLTKLGEKIFKKSDVARSAELVEALARVEGKVPQMFEDFGRADQAAREVALKFIAAQTACSPETPAFHAELRAAIERRDEIKGVIERPRRTILTELERLNLPLINRFRELALGWLKQIADSRKAEPVESVYDPAGDRWVSLVRNNSKVCVAAREFALGAMKEVAGMRLNPLSVIQNRVEALEQEFSRFDFDAVEEDPLGRELAGDLQAVRPPIERFDRGQITNSTAQGAGGYVVARVGKPLV